jgi:hypothetical protein
MNEREASGADVAPTIACGKITAPQHRPGQGPARQRDAAGLVVTTAVHRAGAHAFYARLGYELTGRRYARPL